jgi:hypothetical protein
MEHFEIYDVKKKPCECATHFGTNFDKIISSDRRMFKRAPNGAY